MRSIMKFSEEKPFEPILISPKGASSEAIVHQWVGKCLSTWEGTVEVGFAEVYATLISRPRSGAASRAYGLMTSVTARRQLISGAAEAFYSYKVSNEKDDTNARVRKILKLYSRASERRNEIAHGVSQWLTNEQWDGHYLGPSQMTSRARRIDFTPDYLLNGTQLEDLAVKFDLLGRQAFDLANRLEMARSVQMYLRQASREKPQEQSPEQLEDS